MSKGGDSVRTGKTTLAIEEKMKALDCAKENPKESCRTLSAKFNVGKTQIATILNMRLKYVRVMPHFAEITRERDKVDNRKLTMFCTNGILWLEDLKLPQAEAYQSLIYSQKNRHYSTA